MWAIFGWRLGNDDDAMIIQKETTKRCKISREAFKIRGLHRLGCCVHCLLAHLLLECILWKNGWKCILALHPWPRSFLKPNQLRADKRTNSVAIWKRANTSGNYLLSRYLESKHLSFYSWSVGTTFINLRGMSDHLATRIRLKIRLRILCPVASVACLGYSI